MTLHNHKQTLIRKKSWMDILVECGSQSYKDVDIKGLKGTWVQICIDACIRYCKFLGMQRYLGTNIDWCLYTPMQVFRDAKTFRCKYAYKYI